ncbi:MFS transporter [Ruminococcaceae bacterium OttesenSCG-928-D13]|nr:MFS transporter [Ruminococcaceae bacterium OttesenSCG-928-D13]
MPTPPMAQKHKGAALQLTAVILLVQFGFAFCNTSAAAVINQVIEEFGLSSAGQGLQATVTQAGSFVCILLIPFVGGRATKAALLGFGALLQAVMTALAGVSPTLFLMLACVALVGAGGSLIDVYANAFIIDIHGQNSARFLGMVHGVYGLGAVVTPLLATTLLDLGWRRLYLIVALPLGLIALLFIVLSRRHAGAAAATAPEQKADFTQLGAYLKDPVNLAITLCYLLYNAGQYGMMGWLVRYMTVRYDAPGLGAVGVALFWGCTTLNRFILPRLKSASMGLVAAGLAAGGVLHAVGVFSGSPIVMVAMAGAVGLVSGHSTPLMLNTAASRNRMDAALPTSVLMLCNRLASTLFPLILGAAAALSIQISMLLGAIFMILALLAALRAMRKG